MLVPPKVTLLNKSDTHVLTLGTIHNFVVKHCYREDLGSFSEAGCWRGTCKNNIYLDMWCGTLVCSVNSRCGRRSWSGGWCWTAAWGWADRWIGQWLSLSPAFHCGSLSNRGSLRWRSSGTGDGCLRKNTQPKHLQQSAKPNWQNDGCRCFICSLSPTAWIKATNWEWVTSWSNTRVNNRDTVYKEYRHTK